jgi:pyruvate/2-oxoglutarate dehydrogenase complex dihydrolipoamide dehydrogenase (E3) component
MYRRFGSQVTVIEHADRLIAREDPDVSGGILDIFAAEGIAVVTGARDIRASKTPAGLAITAEVAGGTRRIDGSHLLVAIGRLPNTNDLGLEAAGIKTDPRDFILVDDELRTNVSGVYALGDCNGHGAFTHTSYHDYEIVAANLLDGDSRRLSDRIPAYALFTDPPLGRAGMTEAEVKASGRRALVGKLPMTRVGRARERGETQGFMKVVVDAETERILGAALLCIEGDEIVHSLLDVMAAGAPYTTVQRTMHIHPTVSELIPTLLGDLRPL